LFIDASGQIGARVTPNAFWGSDYPAIQFGKSGAVFSRVAVNDQTSFSNNVFVNSANQVVRLETGTAHIYRMDGGGHIWYSAASGTGSTVATMQEYMRLDSSGRLGLGTSSPSYQLDLGGGTTESRRIQLRRGSDDTNQHMRIGWDGIDMVRSSVSLPGSGVGTQFSLNQVFSDGTRNCLFVDSLGRLGIGVTTPSDLLHLKAATPLQIIEGTGSYSGLSLLNSGGSANATTFLSGTSGVGSVRSKVFAFTNETGTTERARIDSSGRLLIGTSSLSTAKLVVSETSAARVETLAGNSNSQGIAQKNTIVRHYPVVSLGTKLIIPFVSQTSLGSTTICKVWGHSAVFNNVTVPSFEVTFSVGHLNGLFNFASWGRQGNAASIAVNGMNVEITFTTAYTGATADGIFATIEYMTNSAPISIDVANIAMN
jgi:hypothetical protein